MICYILYTKSTENGMLLLESSFSVHTYELRLLPPTATTTTSSTTTTTNTTTTTTAAAAAAAAAAAIPVWACEKVASDLGLGGGLCGVLQFPPLFTTNWLVTN